MTLLAVIACAGPTGGVVPADAPPTPSMSTADTTTPMPANVLVVLIDDIGVDKLAAYGEHPQPAPTPIFDALAADGVLFRNTYATPLCSPTRAALLTGRLPSRNGVGHLMSNERLDLLEGEDGMAAMLARSETPYASAALGKWHLAPMLDPILDHPGRLGFDHWAGSLDNLQVVTMGDGQPRGYTHWEKNTQGVLAYTDTYATTDTTNDAIARVQTLAEPWFVYVSYNAAHEPWDTPPADLHPLTPIPKDAPLKARGDAMIEALDTELGRLLDAMDPELRARTLIVVLSDNGTQEELVREPWPAERGKGTLFEGGVRVPMLIVGPQVQAPGTVSDALVHVVDLFPTAAEVAGVDLDDGIERDGRSLLPWLAEPTAPSGRQTLFTQKFRPNVDPVVHWWTIRDQRHKLWVDTVGVHALYDIDSVEGSEGVDLLADGMLDATEQEAHDRLLEALDVQLAALGLSR